MTTDESLVAAIHEKTLDRCSAAEKLKSIRELAREPDVLDELKEAFPTEIPALMDAWKALLTSTWEKVLSRPKAWKILMRAANKAGISF